ncbi:histidine kinase [Chitinophaga oryzae]|uniref:Histidine kinase n=1 Tax=Chitinophaga oryzae TaxID=2725414 RepID=A0AAE6ZNW2_9BACT|nr:sensor histidine kinase [Chitinophaga oryzae]QJB34850.1 histidine kinase [Chitinophaga oryzae]QJB41362.1 histidine kinase [Chitinophaga oryzae]
MEQFWRKYIFPVLYALVIYVSMRLINAVLTGFRFWERPWQETAIEGVLLFTGYIYVWMLNCLLQYYQRQPKPGPVIREYLVVAAVIITFTDGIILPIQHFTGERGCQLYDVINLTLIPTLFYLLYYVIKRANASLRKSYEQQLLLEKISNDQLQTELRFLKAQFHPHFLFNALNTVYFQMDESVGTAKHTVEKLSELLRYQLYDHQQTVAVGKELQYLQSYIDLQRSRMNEHLRLTVEIDPRLNKQSVYPLLLLPLVENAFKYAGGEYWININASLQNDWLVFHVSNAIPAIEMKQKKGGIGLENLRRRLALLYPGKHDLAFCNSGENYSADLKIAL